MLENIGRIRVPGWGGADKDPLRHALEEIHRDVRAQLREYEEASRHANKKPDGDAAYRDLSRRAVTADALCTLYELAAANAEDEGKSPEEQRVAGREALHTMVSKFQRWAKGGGRQRLRLDRQEETAFHCAFNELENRFFFLGGTHISQHDEIINRRTAVRALGAAAAGLGLGAFVAGRHVVKELPDASATPDTGEQSRTDGTYFTRDSINLPAAGAAAAAAFGAVASIAAAAQIRDEFYRDKDTMAALKPQLMIIATELGKIMQHALAPQPRQSSARSARG